jgi:hypothetical protein
MRPTAEHRIIACARLQEGGGMGESPRAAKEFARFLQSSISSANEVEYHLRVAYDYGLLPKRRWEILTADTIEVRKMTTVLRQRVLATARFRDHTRSRTETPRTDSDLSAGGSAGG